MKCCSTVDDLTGTCTKCGRCALFDDLPIDEERWCKALRSVSSQGSYHYTVTQLFSEFIDDKTVGKEYYSLTLIAVALTYIILMMLGAPISITACIFGVGGSFSLLLVPGRHHFWGLVAQIVFVLGFALVNTLSIWGGGLVPALLLTSISLLEKPKQLLSFEDCQRTQKKWVRTHKDGLFISEAQIGLRGVLPQEAQGVLLVDQPVLVDFFILNGFALKHRLAVLSTQHIALIPHIQKPVYFLHGSGHHVLSLKKKLKPICIGWSQQELDQNPHFSDFLERVGLPVDLLSPRELLEATHFAIRHHCGILAYFAEENS